MVEYLISNQNVVGSSPICRSNFKQDIAQIIPTRLNICMTIKCTCCEKDIVRWKYEIDKIKNVNAYCCKQCKSEQSKEVRVCPICNESFSAYKKEKKVTCSYACSNKHFRTGDNHGNWKQDAYRSTCFLYHKKQCIICNESNIVEVHHYNENHNDNSPENLVPLCPTHHTYMHSRFKTTISSIVEEYVNNFKRPLAE